MAVQAQYPSHVLFLKRNEQERKNAEYPLQAQAAGFLDQSALLFPTQPSNGGNSNTNRKRGREAAAPTAPAVMPSYAVNLLPLQPQQQQQAPVAPVLNTNATATATATTTLIDLSRLHNQQPPPATFVSTGLRLSFEDSHPPQRQNQPQQQVPAQGRSFLSSFLTEELAAQVKQQRDEINSYLQSQAEQLRNTLAESRQRHYRVLLGLAEQSAARRLLEKDAEMERATRRNAELEKRVAQLRAETVAWQAKARAEEATAAALQAQLHQAAQERQSRGAGDPGCSGGADQAAAEDAESAYVDPERREAAAAETHGGPGTSMVCRVCRRRMVGVLLLPCRHLCLCRECGAGAEACPVCLCARTACLEVFLS